MALLDVVRPSLRRSIDLYAELVALVPESALEDSIPGVRCNTIGQQLWCVVGARESYAAAIESGQWSGFTCSLEWGDCGSQSAVKSRLESSGNRLLQAVAGDEFSDAQYQLIVDEVEHEAAHHGQLIRYLYALDLPIPPGWKARYSLDG